MFLDIAEVISKIFASKQAFYLPFWTHIPGDYAFALAFLLAFAAKRALPKRDPTKGGCDIELGLENLAGEGELAVREAVCDHARADIVLCDAFTQREPVDFVVVTWISFADGFSFPNVEDKDFSSVAGAFLEHTVTIVVLRPVDVA